MEMAGLLVQCAVSSVEKAEHFNKHGPNRECSRSKYVYIYIYFYPEKALDSPIECSADLPAERAAALIKYNYRWRIS